MLVHILIHIGTFIGIHWYIHWYTLVHTDTDRHIGRLWYTHNYMLKYVLVHWYTSVHFGTLVCLGTRISKYWYTHYSLASTDTHLSTLSCCASIFQLLPRCVGGSNMSHSAALTWDGILHSQGQGYFIGIQLLKLQYHYYDFCRNLNCSLETWTKTLKLSLEQ